MTSEEARVRQCALLRYIYSAGYRRSSLQCVIKYRDASVSVYAKIHMKITVKGKREWSHVRLILSGLALYWAEGRRLQVTARIRDSAAKIVCCTCAAAAVSDVAVSYSDSTKTLKPSVSPIIPVVKASRDVWMHGEGEAGTVGTHISVWTLKTTTTTNK